MRGWKPALHTYLLEVNVIRELHVLRVDAKNLQTTSGIRDTNVDFTVEPTEPTQGRVNGVRAVGCCHHHDVGTSLHAVHESEELRNDTALDLTVGLLTLWCNGVDFVDEDDGR